MPPITTEADDGVTTIVVITRVTTAPVTVSVALALRPPESVAVIVATPSATPLAAPVDGSTVAIVSSLDS